MAGLLGILVLAGLMPSGESLWFDETITQGCASEPTFHALKTRLLTVNSSETQMPLGMLAFWAWEKLAGSSEWGLRSLNILWTLLAAGALFLAGRRLKLPALPFWLIIQPFLWYYANEVRPYAMQIAGAAWVLYGLVACVETQGRGRGWAWAFMGGSVLVTGASLLGAIPVAMAAISIVALFWLWKCWPSRQTWLPLGLGGLLLLLLGVYDVATLLRGAGGARMWETGLINVGFSAYELLGFIGLGPPRLEIREAARQGMPALLALLKTAAPGISLLALLYFLLLLPLKNGLHHTRKPAMLCIGWVALGSPVLLFVAAKIVAWPFWGRHLAPVLPFSACLIAWLASRFYNEVRSRPLAVLVPTLLAALLMTSALTLRFSARHRKDDYRKASALALQAIKQGGNVWWSADLLSARYYGITFNPATPAAAGCVVAITSSDPVPLETISPRAPALVFTSKPDLFDSAGALKHWLATSRYRILQTFPGFTVWAPPATLVPPAS